MTEPRKAAAAIGIAAVIAGFGGAAIYAATQGNTHVMGGAPRQMSGPPDGSHPGPVGGPGPAAVGATSLHGEFVVPDGTGGYATELTQTGFVTAISSTDITVRSVDGFSQTYAIPRTAGAAGAPFKVNDQVIIRASKNGQISTVTNIGRAGRS